MPNPIPQTARPVPANAGVQAAYRKKLLAMLEELTRSYERWVPAAVRRNPPRLAQDVAPRLATDVAPRLAQDAAPHTPSQKADEALRKLKERWRKKIELWAPLIARAYSAHAFNTSQRAFEQALRDSGWAVKFKISPAMRDAYEAHIAQNISLIKSIPVHYHEQVERIVTQAYMNGQGVGEIVRELKKLYPAAAHRAELIARDQTFKANAVVNKARALELGITEAFWKHSHAGKEPREDHVRADGKRYKIAEGCYISGEYIQPGELINCRCMARVILPGR